MSNLQRTSKHPCTLGFGGRLMTFENVCNKCGTSLFKQIICIGNTCVKCWNKVKPPKWG